eukprot:Gb_35137 [translate_table: standard]
MPRISFSNCSPSLIGRPHMVPSYHEGLLGSQLMASGLFVGPITTINLQILFSSLLANFKVFAEMKCPPVCPRGGALGMTPLCPPSCFEYKGALDVFYKIIRQEGFFRLWRGTNAGLALAVPTVGIYLPCYDIFRDWLEGFSNKNAPQLTPYAPLVAGSLARSLACITCSPIELARTRMQVCIRGCSVFILGDGMILYAVVLVILASSGDFQFKSTVWKRSGS